MIATRTKKSTVLPSSFEHSVTLDFTAPRLISYSEGEKWLMVSFVSKGSAVSRIKLTMSLY